MTNRSIRYRIYGVIIVVLTVAIIGSGVLVSTGDADLAKNVVLLLSFLALFALIGAYG